MHRKIITWICTDEILHFAEMCTDEIVTCAESCICVFVHSADLWFLHLEKYLRCRFAHFVHRRFFAHLHICTFAHLHICRNLRTCAKCFWTCAHLWKRFAKVCAFVKLCFERFSQIFTFWAFFANLSKKSKISENVPKMSRKKLTCSWVVHEWFLGQRVWQHRVAKVARICIN